MPSTITGTILGSTVRGKIYRALFALFTILLVSTATFMAVSQRSLVENLVERQASDLAESYFDNINTLMLTGGMANKDIARQKLLQRPEVLDARIVRGDAVTKLYGQGSDYAKPVDDFDLRGLGGDSIRELRQTDDGRVLTVVMPLASSSDFRGANCIGCHVAPEGEILGAVRVDYSLKALDATVNRDLLINIGITSAIVIIGLFVIGGVFSRVVSRPLRKLADGMRNMAEGNADHSQRLRITSSDELGDLAGFFNQAVEKFGQIIEDMGHRENQATRIKTALDCVTTNVMVADRDNTIIYMNPAVQRMFRNAAEVLGERLPGFDPDTLVGENIDRFHANPGHQEKLLKNLQETYESRIEVGERTFRIIANPVINEQGERLGTAVEWADLTAELQALAEEQQRLEKERSRANENLRIRTALDNVSSAVMVADQDFNIIYLNPALQQMFVDAQKALQQVLPGFDANRLVGANMDMFHKDPAHQRRLLGEMTTSVENQVEVAGLTLRINANPVVDDAGTRLGTVVEWENRTEEVAVENEIERIVSAARAGKLDERIPLAGKVGFFELLASGINDLLELVDNIFGDIAGAMEQMAEGDLTHPIANTYQGAFGRVQSDVNTTIRNVESIVRQLHDAANSISTASREITSGNNNLSARTEQQASALQQTAASMEELTSTVRNNAANARQADKLSSDAAEVATRGGDVVGQAIAAMGKINESSKRIAEIIGVIDEIAFQTNLLALNASVEAARAGEQGRGFAVVASEVRNLAGRAAEAAKQIKTLIQASVAQVEGGTRLVNESGETLSEIVDGVKKVSDIIAEIAAASEQQSAGLDQVNQAITAMDESTQQNAALAEQTSAASASMSEKANDMDRLVGFFKVS